MANSPARSVDVGTVIADTYTIEAPIGRGGMGAVYLARHNRLPDKRVAIKLLHAEVHEDDETLARFKREALIATRLAHPNIVEVHDFNITADGVPYLVLEYIAGESLAQRLRRGALPLEQVLAIVRQVGAALAVAHREGIVHRDLKPANILLEPTEIDGRPGERARILDFGISKMIGSSTVQTQESTLLGTPAYMAPEQAKGEHASVDQRADIFAFGAIVYQMLAGQAPFQGASIPEIVFKVVYEPAPPLAQVAPATSPAVVAAIERAMAKAASDRFPTVGAFVEALTGEAIARAQPAATPSGHTPTAFANTMSSLDASVRSHPITQGTPVDRNVATIASSAAIVVPAAAVESAPAEPPPVTVPPGRRSPALVIGVALGAATLTGVVVYAVTRPAATTVQPAAPGDAARVELTPDATSVTADALVLQARVFDAAPDAAAIAVVPEPKPRPRPAHPADDNEPDDAATAAKLARAEGLAKAGNYGGAERIANEVIRDISGAVKPRQLARAHSIHGAIMCRRDSNLERARIDLARIAPRFAGLRELVRRACRDVGEL